MFNPYDDRFTQGLQVMWGEAFMSPGGNDEVCRTLDGIDLAGRTVLDIGSGLGGPSFCLAERLGAAQVVGVDIDPQNIPRATSRAEARRLSDRVTFRHADACALPFPEDSFDVVYGAGGVFCETDAKTAVLAEIFRVLRPGGWFAANDWFHGGEPFGEEFKAWAGGEALLNFHMITAAEMLALMERAGFVERVARDRSDWYRTETRNEVARLSGADRARLEAVLGADETERWIAGTALKAAAAEQGDLRPHHVRGRKPI